MILPALASGENPSRCSFLGCPLEPVVDQKIRGRVFSESCTPPVGRKSVSVCNGEREEFIDRLCREKGMPTLHSRQCGRVPALCLNRNQWQSRSCMPGPPHLSQALFQTELWKLLAKFVPADSIVSLSLEGVVLFCSVFAIA